MKKATIKELRQGDFFTLREYEDNGENEIPSRLVWIRGEYDRASKSFSCCKFDDINHERFFKAHRVVFTDIYF